MMKVRVLKNMDCGTQYKPGDVFDAEDDLGKTLVANGLAEEIAPPPRKINPFPHPTTDTGEPLPQKRRGHPKKEKRA